MTSYTLSTYTLSPTLSTYPLTSSPPPYYKRTPSLTFTGTLSPFLLTHQLSPTGDGIIINIIVNISTPVLVYGTPILTLNFSSYEYNRQVNQTTFTRDIPFAYISGGTQLVFPYKVLYGDMAGPLEVASEGALKLSNGSRIVQNTAYPSLPVNLSLPVSSRPMGKLSYCKL